MVICECKGELEIKEDNGRMMEISCSKCGLEYKRRWFDRKLLDIDAPGGHTNINITLGLSDLWRVFKRKGVNFAVRFAPKSDWWFQMWTPTWHFGKGPYITVGFWKFRIYRGY
jgi:hypothetical protein